EVQPALPRLDQPLHLARAPYAESPPLIGASVTIGPISKWDRLLSLAGATTHRFELVTFSTMLPEPDNYVRLHPEKHDRFGTPVLDIHIRYSDEVARNVRAAHERLGAILEQAGVRYTFD